MGPGETRGSQLPSDPPVTQQPGLQAHPVRGRHPLALHPAAVQNAPSPVQLLHHTATLHSNLSPWANPFQPTQPLSPWAAPFVPTSRATTPPPDRTLDGNERWVDAGRDKPNHLLPVPTPETHVEHSDKFPNTHCSDSNVDHKLGRLRVSGDLPRAAHRDHPAGRLTENNSSNLSASEVKLHNSYSPLTVD